jgi:hypothetical protein
MSITVCGKCGHVIGARCERCGREMLCSDLSIIVTTCPEPECLEHVLVDPDGDLGAGPIEQPRLRS